MGDIVIAAYRPKPGRDAEACDYVTLHELPETKDMFAQFVPIDL